MIQQRQCSECGASFEPDYLDQTICRNHDDSEEEKDNEEDNGRNVHGDSGRRLQVVDGLGQGSEVHRHRQAQVRGQESER